MASIFHKCCCCCCRRCQSHTKATRTASVPQALLLQMPQSAVNVSPWCSVSNARLTTERQGDNFALSSAMVSAVAACWRPCHLGHCSNGGNDSSKISTNNGAACSKGSGCHALVCSVRRKASGLSLLSPPLLPRKTKRCM